MHTEKYGSGPESFLGLHGWGGTHRTFAPLVSRLPVSASFYAADLPGFGNSAAPRDWTLAAIAEEVADAIKAIPSPQVTLVGNCSGAILGLLAAERAPERISRFVLIDPFAFMPWYFKLFVRPGFGRYAYYSTFANPAGRWLTNLSLKGRRSRDTDMTATFRAVDHEATYRYLSLLAGVESVSRFGGLTTPVDIVHGERTFNAVKRSVAVWQTLWPQARTHCLAGAGHLPIEEATERLCEIIFAPESGPEDFDLCQTDYSTSLQTSNASSKKR